MKFSLPFKITKHSLPDGGTLIGGRGFGLNSISPAFFLGTTGALAAGACIVSGHYLIGPAVLIVSCSLPCIVLSYAERFIIGISGGFLLFRLVFFGITKQEVWTPLDKLAIMHRDFDEWNKKVYANNYRDQVWLLGYDNGWDDPFDRMYFNKGMQDIAFNSSQKAFETELWNDVVEALKKELLDGKASGF